MLQIAEDGSSFNLQFDLAQGFAGELWQNTSGAIDIWEIAGSVVVGTGQAGFADPTTWSVAPPDNTGDLAGSFAGSNQAVAVMPH